MAYGDRIGTNATDVNIKVPINFTALWIKPIGRPGNVVEWNMITSRCIRIWSGYQV